MRKRSSIFLHSTLQTLFCFALFVVVSCFPALEAKSQNSSNVFYTLSQVRSLLINKHISVPSEKIVDNGCIKGFKEVIPQMQFNNSSWNSIIASAQSAAQMYSGNFPRAAENAIMRMAESINDPYTALLTKEDMDKDRLASVSGKFTGIGVELAWKGGLVVVTPIASSPAEKAGILPGDFIVSVDGVPTKGKSFYRAGDMLTGPLGSIAKLGIVRSGKSMSLQVKRAALQLPGVSSKIIKNGPGIIKIGYFSPKTAQETSYHLNNLKGKTKGLILDLRGNPGGDFKQGVQVASLFRSGDLLIKRTRTENKCMRNSYPASYTGPLAVLTDKGTASSAEVVAQSLKGQPNVKVIGRRTFGKAVIQTLFPLPGGYGLRITTGTYLSPKGASVNITGLKPDIELPQGKDPIGQAIIWFNS